MMILRDATMQDAQFLLGCRNDPETRQASINPEEVTLEQHLDWLEKCLADLYRHLFIAEVGGILVGTIRGDFSAKGWEISCAIAPRHRRKGHGTRMVQLALRALPGQKWSRVKEDNLASIKLTEAAGMKAVRRCEGFVYFYYNELDSSRCP